MAAGPVNAIFRQRADGRMLAVHNWRHRSHDDDEVVAIPLDDDEVALLEQMRAEGANDAEIFDRLYQSREQPPPTIPIDQLHKEQLVMLIRQFVGDDLPSLSRMEREDLVAMLRAWCQRVEGHAELR